MRSLILGGNGVIGSRLVASHIARRFPFHATCFSRPTPFFSPLDVRDVRSVEAVVVEHRPEVVFLAAGIASVEVADGNVDGGEDVVVGGAIAAAKALHRTGGRLVVFSSDAVFGECPNARREDDDIAPIGELAISHGRMEEAVRELLPAKHLIVRTSRVFGSSIQKWIHEFEAGRSVSADNERLGQPTFANDLCEVVVDIAARGHTGTLHLCGPDRHTDFALIRLVAHLHGFDADLVRPLAEAEGLRPRDPWLDRFAARRLCGATAIRPISDAIRSLRDLNRERGERTAKVKSLRAA